MAKLILARFLAFFSLVTLCAGITFDIERPTSNSDIIPNDFTISGGRWLKTTCRNQCGNSYLNTDNQVSGCKCACKYSHSTFRMAATASTSGCIKNEDIRKETGKKKYF